MDLDKANLFLKEAVSRIANPRKNGWNSLRVGVDLGTAYSVVAVVDEIGLPVAGAFTRSDVVREGLIYDFYGAVQVLKKLKREVEEKLGVELEWGATSFPPGTEMGSRRATCYVLEAAGLEVVKVIDEPSAANAVLNIENGVIVDVGGGTTGIAVIQDGKIVYTADEATGGNHFTLVIAGGRNISFEEAEQYKISPQNQKDVLIMVRPVIEKVSEIVRHHIKGYLINGIYLVGGTCSLKGMTEIIQNRLNIPCYSTVNPMFVTPFGIALHGYKQDEDTIY